MKLKTVLIFCLIFAAVSAVAQMGGPPGPEVKKLDYLVGTWVAEGTVAQGPWGMGGKFTSTDTSEWMPGNFFVVSHSEFKMPPELGGDGKAIGVTGYDAETNAYTFDQFNSLGRRESSKGAISGDTWTWTSSANYGGQEIQSKMTVKVASQTSYTFKLEVSMDGKNWMTFMEGKATKK